MIQGVAQGGGFQGSGTTPSRKTSVIFYTAPCKNGNSHRVVMYHMQLLLDPRWKRLKEGMDYTSLRSAKF